MRHHLPQKLLHSKGGSHKDTLLCTPLLWDTPVGCVHVQVEVLPRPEVQGDEALLLRGQSVFLCCAFQPPVALHLVLAGLIVNKIGLRHPNFINRNRHH